MAKSTSRPKRTKGPRKSAAKRPRKSAAKRVLSKSCQVISVYGPFGSRALVDMPRSECEELFAQPVSRVAPARTVDAVLAELADLVERHPDLPVSAAATAETLAFELDSPFNSATSKGQCAKVLMEAMARLREFAPAEEEDRVDEIAGKRRERRRAATKG